MNWKEIHHVREIEIKAMTTPFQPQPVVYPVHAQPIAGSPQMMVKDNKATVASNALNCCGKLMMVYLIGGFVVFVVGLVLVLVFLRSTTSEFMKDSTSRLGSL